jgi:hypothetical protein
VVTPVNNLSATRRTASNRRLIAILLRKVLPVPLMLFAMQVAASPNMNGQTGLVEMPSARIDADGTLRFGVSHDRPYRAFWSSLSMFPWLELGARYTSIDYTTAISSAYGTYKDKTFDAKLRLLPESTYLPELSIGKMDFLGSVRVFPANYVAMSKKIGPLDFTLGYGDKRIDGGFGGITYQPAWARSFEFVYEYDAYKYKEDKLASTSGADKRLGGSTLAINYRWGWLGAQLAWQRGGQFGLNGYVSIPLMQREFVPKLNEPPPFKQHVARATVNEWQANDIHRADLITALEVQDFKNVQVLLHDNELDIGFSTRDITLVGRAVGRVARTALLMGPSDISRIRITWFTLSDLALVTYEFNDLPLLTRFFEGHATYADLIKGMTVSYADPATADLLDKAPAVQRPLTVPLAVSPGAPQKSQPTENQPAQPSATTPSSTTQTQPQETQETQIETKQESQQEQQEQQTIAKKQVLQWVPNEEGQAISLRQEDSELSRFRLTPFNLGIYFNDAGGAFRYDTFALAKYTKHFGRGWFFDTSLRATWLEDVSKVKDESNSLLPHVRSDVADYKRAGRFKLNNLMVNKYLQLRPRVYSRFSIGYYEEMYGGFGGQLLYLPKQSSWAVDVSVDRVRKRNTDGGFGFRDYTTTTALAALHYQLPWYGTTVTLRAGQFLAKDKGVRYELQRRFRSGVRIGAWYTMTDGKDITQPGRPGHPYRDKGIFISIPLGSMLTKDTRATARLAISPWTRDVGQMVQSPGDLYSIIEDPLMLDWQGYNLLTDFNR